MARVKIERPKNWVYETTLKVRVTDLNYGNHLGNQQTLGLLHECRMEWLHSNNLSEKSFFGGGLIMADCAIQFKAEAFFGDELIIKMGVGEITASGFELLYSVVRKTDQKNITAAKTAMVCFDYTHSKMMRISEEAKYFLGENYEGK